MKDVPVTKTGLENMKKSLEEMQERRPKLKVAVAAAREKGDLNENAEYHAAKEELSILETRIGDLSSRVSRARIIEMDNAEKDAVRFTAKVLVKDFTRGVEETYQLVGDGEDDIFDNKILVTSPMGQALLGKKVGDTAEVQTPKGLEKYQILEISY